MTHTVCGQPVVFQRWDVSGEPPIVLMVPHCPTCGRNVEAMDELTRDLPRVSPGRPWEVDEE